MAAMTDTTARVSAAAIALVVFFLAWAVISAKPFAAASPKDERLVALEQREQRLRKESERVKRLVEWRFANYRVKLRHREKAIAKIRAANAQSTAAAAAAVAAAPVQAPSVSVVSVPPVTSTGSS
jgi:hypothetical protein